IVALKDFLGYPSHEPFFVPEEVYAHYNEIAQEGAAAHEAWNVMFEDYRREYPELAKLWDEDFKEITLEELEADSSLWEFEDKPQATRNVSGIMINRLK